MDTESGPGRILLAIDGEPHTRAAMEWALELGARFGWEVTAVHVKDPYLKQFFNDIYAQGRQAYLDHVEACLAAKAEETTTDFEKTAHTSAAKRQVKILDGDPAEALLAELADHRYTLLVLGRKNLTGLAAWRSRDLPGKLAASIKHLPVLVVPQL